MLGLILALALTQQQPTMTLVFKDREETITVAQGRREFAGLAHTRNLSEAQHARLVAITIALGTLPDEEPIVCIGSRCEVLRGIRLPAQGH